MVMAKDVSLLERWTLGEKAYKLEDASNLVPFQTFADKKFNECISQCLHALPEFSLDTMFSSLYEACVTKLNNNDIEGIYTIYLLGVACLQSFVQANWTGPESKPCSFESKLQDSDVKEKALTILGREESDIYHLVQIPHYLLIAEEIFRVLVKLTEEKTHQFCTVHWWLFRCYNVHTQVLNVHSESLFSETKALIGHLFEDSFFQSIENKSLKLQLHLEAGQVLLHYYQYNQANDHFNKAKSIAGIEFSFTGALGYRTKFQQNALPQLHMVVKTSEESKFDSVFEKASEQVLPKTLSLNDDTLLEHVRFVNENEVQSAELCMEQAAIVLAACTSMQKTSPSNKLQQEEISAIIEVLLGSMSCWCIRSETLRIRCHIEKDRSRTVERCMMQLEDLVSLISQKESDACDRLDLFYSVRPFPIWLLKKQLAGLYMSLGAVGSAFQQYEFLEMWEEAINCLIRTERTSAAIEMIENQLKIKETATLWCLLGDVLQEPKHYYKAWEFSKHRSSRAMRSLGGYYTSKKSYKEAIECFEKSLSVLSLQVGTWFTLGCTLLIVKEYVKAATAFRRCVLLEWDNFEAWTNLSVAYIRCGKKQESFKTLSEAIKCNFSKWQLWENYVAVSTDVGQFREAINAYERLLTLKDKFVDIPILQVLVRAVIEDVLDANEQPASKLKPSLLKLFGHICSKMSTDPMIWSLYAKLTGNGLSKNQDDNEKSIDFLHKSLRTGMQKAGWEKSEEAIGQLVDVSKSISNACAHCQDSLSRQVLASLRMTLNSFLTRLKQRQKSILDSAAQENFESSVKGVEEIVQGFQDLLLSKQ